jgi:hypothetical protein
MGPFMALIRIPEQDGLIRDSDEARQWVAPFGICNERWLAEGCLPTDETPDAKALTVILP